MAECRYQF